MRGVLWAAARRLCAADEWRPCTASIASCAILNPQRRRAREAAESNRIRGPPRGCGKPAAAAQQAKARVDKPAVYPLRFLSTPRRQKRAYNFICTLMRELTFIACVLHFSGAARSAASLSYVLSQPEPRRVRLSALSPPARRPEARPRGARAARGARVWPVPPSSPYTRVFAAHAVVFSFSNFYSLEINHRLYTFAKNVNIMTHSASTEHTA